MATTDINTQVVPHDKPHDELRTKGKYFMSRVCCITPFRDGDIVYSQALSQYFEYFYYIINLIQD